MKRILALVLIIILILSLSSCAVEPAENTTDDTELTEAVIDEIEEIPEEVPLSVGVFWYDYSDAFLTKVREALNSELDTLGIKYTNYDAASTQARQNEQIDTAISQGANLLIVNLVDIAAIDAAQAITDKAKAADIPVIFFNREVDDTAINSYENACFVGTRHAEAAEKQGEMAGEFIVENYDKVDLNNDGFISYILMAGELNNEATVRIVLPVKFCNKELVSADKPELIYYDAANTDCFQPGNWSKTTAFELMEYALSTNPMDGDAPIEMVFAACDDMAIGCIEALNNVGWNTGEETDPYIPIFGIDYTSDGAAAIEAEKMIGSILLSYNGMATTIAELVENVMNGEHVFESAHEVFNVDEGVNKIRVPYEIKMKESN